MLFYGLLNLSFTGYVVVVLIFTQISIAMQTLFLHRSQAHRGLTLHPVVNHFFRFWMWLTTGIVTKAWVAIHRKHHAKCETSEDPHSPQILGLATVFFQGSELYRKEAANLETLARYGAGTPDDWIEQNVYTKYHSKGILLMLLIDIVLFGVPGIMVWAIQMAWSPLFAAGIINGIGHFWGYRNFDCPDAGRNIVPWGIIIGGEELHNNHHAYPTSSKLSIKPWEFDIGWLYIRILQTFGLAQPTRVVPVAQSESGKTEMDGETLGALIQNRIHVMAEYTKQVLLPTFKAAMQEARQEGAVKAEKMLKHARNVLVKEAISDTLGKRHVEHALSHNESLAQVYDFKTRLQAIWDHTTATQKELLDALHQWCQEAEATGEKALRKYSDYIKGYKLKRA